MHLSEENKLRLELMISGWLSKEGILPLNHVVVIDLRITRCSVIVNPVDQNPGIETQLISALGLERRIMTALKGANITTVAQLIEMGAYNLCRYRGIGILAFRTVRSKLEEHGCRLGREWMTPDKYDPDDWRPKR